MSREARKVLAVVLMSVLILSGLSGGAVGAGSTDVEIVPSSVDIATGSTTTVDIVVTNATGGVGAVNVTFLLESEGVATIVDASLDDTAYSTITRTNTGNTSVTLIGYGLNTDDSGRVSIGSLTVRGDSTGTTAMVLQVDTIGDESGVDYSVSSASGTTISVSSTSDGGNGGDGSDGGDDGDDGDDSDGTTTTDESNTGGDGNETTTTITSQPTTQTTESQAPGFGLFMTVLTFIATVTLLLRVKV